MSACLLGSNGGDRAPWEYAIIRVHVSVARLDRASTFMAEVVSAVAGHWPLLYDLGWDAGCFRHQLLLPSPYLVLTKPLRLDIQCQRGASVKIGWKYLDD